MPLVDAKCTNCAGILKVDDSKEAAVCPYCGSAYIVEKAINNFNITNNINVKDSVVNVYMEQSFDAKGHLSRAKQAMKFFQYEEAEEIFRKVLDNDPRNESASTGLMLCTMMNGLLTWEKEVFLRVPDSKNQSFLKGNQKDYNDVCVVFKNELMRAVSYNPGKLYVVMDYLAVRGCVYEEKYRKTRKYPYYACASMYFYLFSQNFSDNEYSKLLMDRMKYYNDYDEYSKKEIVYSWDEPLTWDEYVSYDELKDKNLMREGKYLFRATEKEEFEKVAMEYTLSKDYGIKER